MYSIQTERGREKVREEAREELDGVDNRPSGRCCDKNQSDQDRYVIDDLVKRTAVR